MGDILDYRIFVRAVTVGNLSSVGRVLRTTEAITWASEQPTGTTSSRWPSASV